MFSAWQIIIPAMSGILGVVIAAVAQWYVNVRAKRQWDVFLRKEKIYSRMLELTKGFYSNTLDKTQIDEFLSLIKLLWLYAPSDVIKNTYDFTDKIHAQKDRCTDDEKEQSLENLVRSLREDMIKNKMPSQSKLENVEFQHLRPS